MESHKIFGFLILIFLCLSLLFCFLYANEVTEKTVISEEFVFEAVDNLNSHGIKISESVLVREIPETNIYCIDLDFTEKYNSTLSKTLISGVFGENVSTTEFDTPSGITLGIYSIDGDGYELGRMVFFDEDFSFNIARQGISMTGGDDPILNGNTEFISDSAQDCIDKICGRLTENNRFDYRIAGSAYDDEYLIVTVVQTVDGYDLNDLFVNFVFNDNEIIIISGKWITLSPKPEYHNTLTDGINILYNLDFDEVSEINDERVVFSLRKTLDSRYFLLPSWEIKYTDLNGNYKKAYYDAI